jgi:transcriptional regulator with XRE-family HTH domain
MLVTNESIITKIREYRTKAGKTQQDLADLLGKTSAAISDMERGKVQVSASDLSKIADFLNVPVNSFYGMEIIDPEIQNAIYSLQEEPEEARLDSFAMIRLYLEIQNMYKKYSKKDDLSPEELGGIVTKMLQFRAQYNAMSKKFNEVMELLVQELEKRGITLPKT